MSVDNERVRALEVQMKEVLGNGKAGRLDKVEKTVEAHSKLIWVGLGIVIALQILSGNWLTTLVNLIKLLGK